MPNDNIASSWQLMPRLVAIAMTLLVGVGAMTIVSPDPASADTERPLRNVATQRCLESDIFTIGFHGISTQPCRGLPQQQWHFHPGTYATRVMNYTSGRCLDSNARGLVYGNPCTANNSYQEWRVTASFELRNVATGRCLDSNSRGEVATLPCRTPSHPNQRWQRR